MDYLLMRHEGLVGGRVDIELTLAWSGVGGVCFVGFSVLSGGRWVCTSIDTVFSSVNKQLSIEALHINII